MFFASLRSAKNVKKHLQEVSDLNRNYGAVRQQRPSDQCRLDTDPTVSCRILIQSTPILGVMPSWSLLSLQVAAFRNLVHGGHPLVDNFRSTQPLNSRVISSSFEAAG